MMAELRAAIDGGRLADAAAATRAGAAPWELSDPAHVGAQHDPGLGDGDAEPAL